MKFANVVQIAALSAIGLVNCAIGVAAHAQQSHAPVARVFYSRGEQQWRYSRQRAETAPVIVFQGVSSALVRGDVLPPWFAMWNTSARRVRVGPLTEQLAPFGDAVIRAFDAYVQTLSDVLGQSNIAPIVLSRDTTILSGNLSGRVKSLRGADTVVNGVSLRIMTDIANVVLTDTIRWPKESLESGRIDVQRLRGTVTTRRLYDIVTRVSIHSWDSVAITGRETRTFADGRVISDAVHYQLVRHGEMFALSDVEKRATQFADSLDKIADFFTGAYLQLGDSLKREAPARLLARHDKAAALATLQFPETLGLTNWHYNLLRPALNDPRRAMRLGFDANIQMDMLRGMASDLLRFGPTEPRPVYCSEDACRLIQREWTRADEPQLRNIGLMFRYVAAPACYLDALLEQSKAYPTQFDQMLRYVMGVTQANSNAPAVAMPTLGDGWRSWFDWLRGGPAEYFAAVQTSPPRTAADSAARAANPFGFGTFVVAEPALKHIAYRTGFAYRDSFNVRLARESNDTARAVYSTMSKWIPPREAFNTTSAQWRANRICQKRQ